MRTVLLVLTLGLLAAFTGCTTLPRQTAEQTESPTSLPVVHGCEVDQQLPIGVPCEWSIPDADGMISAESRDGRHLSLKLNVPGPCKDNVPIFRFEREVPDPYGVVELPGGEGRCNGRFDLKDGHVLFGVDGSGSGLMMEEELPEYQDWILGSGLMVELAFGEHGWTVIQTPPMTP